MTGANLKARKFTIIGLTVLLAACSPREVPSEKTWPIIHLGNEINVDLKTEWRNDLVYYQLTLSAPIEISTKPNAPFPVPVSVFNGKEDWSFMLVFRDANGMQITRHHVCGLRMIEFYDDKTNLPLGMRRESTIISFKSKSDYEAAVTWEFDASLTSLALEQGSPCPSPSKLEEMKSSSDARAFEALP